MTYQEPKYCYNCDAEAVCYVEWRNANGILNRRYMCATCRDAFEFGQVTPQPTVNLEKLDI